MPLIKSKSKQAFGKNVAAEEHAGKKPSQALAIAYSVKRKAPQKKAEGGPVSAKTEKRPMPDQDSHERQERDVKTKGPGQDSWTDRPDKAQSQNSPKPKLQPIKGDRMVDSSVIKASRIDTLGRRLDEVERHLGTSVAPSSDKDQPDSSMNEMGAQRQGPSTPDLKLKKMASGGKINDFESMSSAEDDGVQHPAGLESDNDQMRPQSKEYMAGYMAGRYAAGGSVEEHKASSSAVKSANPTAVPWEAGADEHEDGSEDPTMAAEGGLMHEMDDIDVDEMDNEKHSSIAAAIMAKKKGKPGSASGSVDEEDAERDMMAEGGQVDLSRNADEDLNAEDQMSFEAGKKENYSETPGLDALDSPMDSNETGDEREDESENKHDMISSIRSKMKSRRQFAKP